MRKYLFISLCILGCCTLKLPAQEVLSLDMCREMALRNNKEMAAAGQQTQSARYLMKSYKGNFFPNLTANATGLYSTTDGGYSSGSGQLPVFSAGSGGQIQQMPMFAYFPGIDLNYKVGGMFLGGVQLEQPLYMGGKIQAAYKMASLGKDMAQMNEVLTANEVIVETDQAFIQVVKAQEMKKVAERYHAVLTELFRNVESAHKHGLKPQNDVLKVQVKLNESELSMRKAQNALRLATMNLCHMIGKPLDEKIQIAEGFPATSLSSGTQVADISARPEYAILNKQEDIARQQIKLNRSELLPKIGLMGSYNYLNGFKLNNERFFNDGSFSVLLNVSVPLYHFGERTHKVHAAKAKLEQTRLERENLNEKMLLELTQAANNLDEAQLECQLADRSLEQAEENMKVSQSQYNIGLETLSDHLEAQALWQKAYEAQVEARYLLYLNQVKYQKASGTLYSVQQ